MKVGGEACKYSFEKDMFRLSKKFSDVVFRLHGDGDESDDFWIEYWQNGKVQDAPARIEYDDFDPKKLKDKSVEFVKQELSK